MICGFPSWNLLLIPHLQFSEMFLDSSCTKELNIVKRSSPVASSVLMFSFSKIIPIPKFLSFLEYVRQSCVFLANLEIDLTMTRSIFWLHNLQSFSETPYASSHSFQKFLHPRIYQVPEIPYTNSSEIFSFAINPPAIIPNKTQRHTGRSIRFSPACIIFSKTCSGVYTELSIVLCHSFCNLFRLTLVSCLFCHNIEQPLPQLVITGSSCSHHPSIISKYCPLSICIMEIRF